VNLNIKLNLISIWRWTKFIHNNKNWD